MKRNAWPRRDFEVPMMVLASMVRDYTCTRNKNCRIREKQPEENSVKAERVEGEMTRKSV